MGLITGSGHGGSESIIRRGYLRPETAYAYYLNHSCNPNSGIRDKVIIVAMRDIERGEEITLDYSITEADRTGKLKCKCGDQNCRKIIRSIQFLPKKFTESTSRLFQNSRAKSVRRRVINSVPKIA